VAKLVWRVRLVAELEPGVATETEPARIVRDDQASLAELGLRLDEAKRLTAGKRQRLAAYPRRNFCRVIGGADDGANVH